MPLYYYTNSTYEAVFITESPDQETAYQRIAEYVRNVYAKHVVVDVASFEVTELTLPPEPDVLMIRTWE